MELDDDGDGGGGGGPVVVLPLYAMLPAKEQMKVFAPAPPGARLIIVATNVAETSITIPGIRYVVDAGKTKQRRYQEGYAVSKFELESLRNQVASLTKEAERVQKHNVQLQAEVHKQPTDAHAFEGLTLTLTLTLTPTQARTGRSASC